VVFASGVNPKIDARLLDLELSLFCNWLPSTLSLGFAVLEWEEEDLEEENGLRLLRRPMLSFDSLEGGAIVPMTLF